MKKSSLLLSLLLLAGRLSATDVYCFDFEEGGTVPLAMSNAGWLLSGPDVVDNPVKAGLNSSDKVLTFEGQEGIEWWGGVNLTLNSVTTDEKNRYMYMMVRADSEVTADFAFSLFNEGTYLETVVHTLDGSVTIGDEWKEIGFIMDTDLTFDEIRITPNAAAIFYVDNIRLSDDVLTPEVLPDLEPVALIDFEEGELDLWSEYSEGAFIEVSPNPSLDPLVNNSENVLKVWIPKGFSPYYNGAKLNVEGTTTESSRYLHVKYFHHQNENSQEPQTLQVLVDGNETVFTSDFNNVDEWNDVTIDLGVGTRIKFLNFFVDGWWQNLYLDDIVLDGAEERDDTPSGMVENEYTGNDIKIIVRDNHLYVSTGDDSDCVEVYEASGALKARSSVNGGTCEIGLSNGFYLVKIFNEGTLKAVRKVVM